ncbi:MAG TPA: 2-succinyl-5-enolpyruvyl-6-hydroxy-3-cyclohexene-1-carboxylic-acid synthase, partial [Acidimicrobiales bacterium]|nr:2-succinyl-5-enolpyruvyl-6-hydroxy-3-cyclohexene-1-carboxylic-acid synthase [Acidimicrobiales bacterium]
MSSAPPAPADVQATFAATLVDEWVRDGLVHAVVCPGSRSTPLALALADHPGVRLHVHHDERSGAFLALGLGLASRRPALVLTTSGTAAAELHPAVVEADLAGVPLLVCTADRPPELRDVGAPQAIDQLHLYGRSVRWFADPGVPDASGAGRWRAFAARAHAAALGPPPGPVQVNLPFREPLVGTPGPLPPARSAGPWVVREEAPAAPVVLAVPGGVAGRKGLVAAGDAPLDPDLLAATAAALGWPVVAEPRSPGWRPGPATVPHLDAILRSGRAAADLRPDVVLRLGPPASSRVVNEWLAASGAHEIVAGAPGWSDPAATAATVTGADPDAVLAALRAAAAADPAPPVAGWLDRWQAASRAAAGAAAGALAALPAPSEPAVARSVVAALPDGARLVVSSSMPVRDVERYAAPRTGLTVLANRGANGIDGVVSTAAGVAIGSGAPTALLIGDIAFLHDSNGLLGLARRDVDLTCVVVD